MTQRNLLADFLTERSGAVAPMYALALFGLITVAGVGWDYSRLMTMDSELQNAADQAALAAATQLDGLDGAMPRARAAAKDYFATAGSQWVNRTKLSNDGDGDEIVDLAFTFYAGWDHVTDTPGAVISNDSNSRNAKYVRVLVGGREAFYALTAIGGTLSSGDIFADAVATLETAVCKAPKMFICAPSRDFPTPADTGRSFILRQLPNATDAMAPGNFGFLDPGGTTRSNNVSGNPNRELGRNTELSGCISSTGIESEPGFVATETNALNTRFDIYNPPGMPGCNSATGDFCPAQNTVTQWVYKISLSPSQTAASASCPASPPNNASRMKLADAIAEMGTATNSKPGYQRDECLLNGSCNTVGNGDWSAQSYMNANHGGTNATDISNGTRYGVYKWELANAATRLPVRKVGYTPRSSPSERGTLYCSYPKPVNEPPFVPTSSQKDRRILTVASVDCTNLNGREQLDILRWADLFLTDASASTGPNAGEINTEIVGPAQRPGGGYAFQYYGRKKPVLVR